MHIDPTARTKLDAKSKKCFFVGNGDSEFGYRLWMTKTENSLGARI